MKKQGADVIGAKAGAKPKKPYIQKDTIGSTQNAEIVYGIGDGENGGLINGLNSIILDDTRVIGDSGEINFNEVKYEERFGLIDQPPLKLIEDTITERGLNLEVRYAAPVVSSFNNKDVDKFVVRISVPSLMQNKDNGDSVAATISYAIDIAVDGGAYQTVVEASATEKITDGYEFDHEIEAPEGTRRTIRVRRTKPDSTSQLLIDKFYVAAISEVINAKFSHPTLHYIGLVFNAEQFNNIPKAVFHYYGRKIKVPVNYNPTTRQYDGIWNGTFKVVYSNNPAWVLFDILTDRRSGLGRRIPVELVDKWELYRIAQYCDELVPDGEGGMEPRFVCNNLVLNSKQDAYQVLKDIASIFRGQSFWNGSQVVTVADAPRDIDYAISMASVISYSYSGTARNARHNVVKVQYYDKNNEYAAAYEYATDYDSIRETEQINEVEIRAFGCTSAGQAQRLARYTLLSEQTETRILTAKLSIDAFVNMQIGDVFAWSDKFLAGANNGGRVVAVNGAVLTLDRDVTDSALVGDTLFVNTTSGKASTRTITAINGNKVTLDAVMSTTEPEFVWVIDSAELSLLYFKLDDYKVNPAEGTVDIVGIQHVNSKFGTIDTETALEAPPFSKVEIETLRAPGNVITSFNVRVDQGLNIADLYVSWGQVKGATRYTVEFRRDSQAWRVLGNVTGLTHTIENVSAGIYEVRVRAADSIGNLSPYGFSAPINVAGIVLPPPKLASFTAVGKLLAIETKWSFPAGTEASLAVVIEHATQDPKNVGVPTQKLNIPYPQTEYVFNGLGAHTKMWFRAAIVDKYNQEGAFTALTTATADANPEELIDVISGHISEGTLDQTLKGKIDGAGALAGEAQDLANQAKTAAANAQTTANNAATAASDAAGKATAAANAAAKEATDRATAIAAEAKARTDGLAKEATDRAAALTTQSNTLKADSDAKVKALKDEVDPKLVTLQDGITKVPPDYKAGDTAVVGQLNAYKTSNDSTVASVLQKAESAVSTGSTNSSAITAINGQIATINNTKLDASVISGYYTKGQTDAKAAEIAAGKVEEFKANLKIGGRNLWNPSETISAHESSGSHTNNSNAAHLFLPTYLEVSGSKLLLQIWNPNKVINKSNTNRVAFYTEDKTYISSSVLNLLSGETYQKQEFNIPANAKYMRLGVISGLSTYDNSIKFKFELGTVYTEWTASEEEVANSISATSTAIQNTNAGVTRVDGRVTAANEATTALAGRVSTVEGAVSTKAEAAALTALTTRVSNAEGVNTSQGSAITSLENSVNHATTGLASKASSSALTAVDNKVTAANGRIDTTNSNVTALTGRVSTVENGLATKADVSALNNIYTKSETDAKATSLAAGEISKYDASLVIGGTNLFSFAGAVAGYINPVNGEVVTTSAAHQSMNTLIPLGSHKSMTYQVWNPAAIRNTDNINRIAFFRADGSFLSTTNLPGLNGTTYQTTLIQIPDAATHARLGVLAGPANGGRDVNVKVKIEFGNKATDWSEADSAILDSLNTNATAITNTNAEVARVDGRVTTESNRTTTLTGRVSTVEGDLAKKADASALSALTTRVETEEGKSTSQGSAITALQNTINHATTGLATKASSSALTAVDNKVTAANGRIDTTNSNVTTLSGRVDTVEGDISKKADASALNSLTTRVETEEGKSTSQGTAITALQNSVNHATTGLSTKASSAALTAVDNKVIAVDGRVTATNSNVTALTGRVSNVEGAVATKADSSVLVDYSTKTATDEAIAAATTALKASLGLYALPTDKDTSQQNKWARITLRKTQPYISNSVVPDYSYIGTYPEHSEGYFAEGATTTLPIDHSINYYRTLINVAAASTINLGNLMGDDAHAIYVDGKEVYRKTAYGTNACSFEVTAGDHVVDIVVNNGTGGAGFSSTITMSSQVTSMYAPKLTGVLIGNKAEASAIQTTNTEVSRINGVVSGHVTDIRNLTTSIAGKADASAVNALTVRVAAEEGKSTSQGTAITNLENAVNNSTTGLASKASAQALTTLNNQVQHSTTGLSAVNTKVDNLKATVENTTNGLASKASSSALNTLENKVNHSTTGLDAVASNVTSLQTEISYASAKKSYILATHRNGTHNAGFMGRGVFDEKKNNLALFDRGLNLIVWAADGTIVSCTPYDTYAGAAGATSLASAITALAANTYFSVVGIDHVGSVLKTHAALRAAIVGNGGSDAYYDQWAGMFMPLFTSKKGQATGTGIQHSFNSDISNDWIHYLLEFVAGIPVGLAGAAPVDTSNFATASAVESLTTRVSTAEGKISSEATKLTNLTTTVDGHTTTINSQTTSINGIRGVHALKFETNGVISGYGLISELVNGTVKSQFGINADSFFIGAPSSNKKPFVVLTTPGLINGVTVPAGTYIDTAFIGSATIGTAHIRDLHVTTAKIGNGAITTAKIGDLQVDTLKIANNAVTVPVYSYVSGNTYMNSREWITSQSIWAPCSNGVTLFFFNFSYDCGRQDTKYEVMCRILKNGVIVKPEFSIFYFEADLNNANIRTRPAGTLSLNHADDTGVDGTFELQFYVLSGNGWNVANRYTSSLTVRK